MANPWEEYKSPENPWEEYSAPSAANKKPLVLESSRNDPTLSDLPMPRPPQDIRTGRGGFSGRVRRTLDGNGPPKIPAPTGRQVLNAYGQVATGAVQGVPSGIVGLPGDAESVVRAIGSLDVFGAPVSSDREDAIFPTSGESADMMFGKAQNRYQSGGRDLGVLASPLVIPKAVKIISAPGRYVFKGEKAAEPVLRGMGNEFGLEAVNANLKTSNAQSTKTANIAKLLEESEKATTAAMAARGNIATAEGASAATAKARAAETFANAPNRVLEAGQEATGIAPPLARPAALARISAGKAGVTPLFEESFGLKSTAPLKDQYENAFNDASRNARVAQQELADAENSHTQLLARANDQTSVYGINPGQIRESEKAIEAASERAAAAAEEAARVKTDLSSIQNDILEGKQGAVYTPRISILLQNPKVKSGISRGVKIIQNEADAKGEIPNFRDLSIKIDRQGNPILDANGDVQPIGVPNTRTLHVAKRGLDAFVNSTKDDFGRIVYDADGEVKSIQAISKTLSSEMRRVNPTYDKAMFESEKYLKTRTGFIKGAKYVFDDKLPESDFKDILGRMSQEERDAAIESVSNFANETVRQAAPQAGAKVPLASISRRSEAKLAMLIGDKNASNYMSALRGARPSAKGAAIPVGKSPALKEAGENIQAAEKTTKGLRKEFAEANQELAKIMRRSRELEIRQVFYETAPLKDIGERVVKDLTSDFRAGLITSDKYKSSIRAIEEAQKNLAKTQRYRNVLTTIAKGATKAAGLAAGLRMGGVGVESFIP